MTSFPLKFLAALLLGTALIAGGWLAGWEPVTFRDLDQSRLNQAAPVPQVNLQLLQTFVPDHNGLSAIEVVGVVYANAPSDAGLSLRLLDANKNVLASTVYQGFAHNASLRLNFTPRSDSAGQSYTLVVAGDERNNTTVWMYSLDGYRNGSLTQSGQPFLGDLRFTTFYTYLPEDMAQDVLASLGRLLSLALPLWVLLFAPGLLILSKWETGVSIYQTSWTRWGLALGLSVALAPLSWLWITTVGLSWSATALRIVYALIGLVAVGQIGRALWRQAASFSWSQGRSLEYAAHHLGMAAVLCVSLASRLVAIRDLSFPMWVDSSHHLLIARLLMALGRVPVDYQPVLPVGEFSYHFGFHALAVVAQWLTDLSLPDTFLFVGQILNGLTPLAVYAFVVTLTRRPRAGLIAAFITGLVSIFPAYYLVWGRYTQLTGLLILGPLLAVVWQLVTPSSEENNWRSTFGNLLVVSLLASGLLLTHYRLWAFFVTFALVALAGGRRGGWKTLLGVALIGGGLSFPWLVRLVVVNVRPLLGALPGLTARTGYNAFPVDYFRRELEEGWLALALLGLAWGLWRRERVIWVVAGWVALTFALLNIGPGTWLVNNTAWAITLFFPGALLLGYGMDAWLVWAQSTLATWFQAVTASRQSSRIPDGQPAIPRPVWLSGILGMAVLALIAGLVSYAGIRGLAAQINMVNPVTQLATAEDMDALTWLDEALPAQAVILINSWDWLNTIWAGSDGGAWIWPLFGRASTLPPLDYIHQPGWRDTVRDFNIAASQIKDATAPKTLALLQSAGVTHIFIGARGGFLKPEMFLDKPHYQLLYSNGAAWVFAFTP